MNLRQYLDQLVYTLKKKNKSASYYLETREGLERVLKFGRKLNVLS